MHRTTRRLVTGGATLGVAALLAVPAVVFAGSGGSDPSTPTTTAPPTTSGPSSTTKPSTPAAPAQPRQQGRASAIKSVLDGLVKDGTITQAQEDAIVKALEAAKPALPEGPGGGGGPLGRIGFGLGLEAAAKALGISVDELRTELQTKTIAQIATDHGINLQQVIDQLTAAAKTQLDAAVKAGHITQAQADGYLKQLSDKIDQLVNQKLPLPENGGWHRGGPGRPGAPSAPGNKSGSAPSTTEAPTTTTTG